jgi:hypothetical protein
MRYGIEMMMVRRRLKGKKLFIEAAGHYRNSLRLDEQNTLAGGKPWQAIRPDLILHIICCCCSRSPPGS